MRWVDSLTRMSAFCRAASGRAGTSSGASALLVVASGLCGALLLWGWYYRKDLVALTLSVACWE